MVIDPALRALVAPNLQSGEKLLWVGKPTPLRVILQDRKVVTVAIVTLLALAALTVIVLIFPNSHLLSLKLVGMGWSFGLVVLGFLLLGLTYFARPIYEYFMARRTIYAITDRRAIILKGTLRGRKVEILQAIRIDQAAQPAQRQRRSVVRQRKLSPATEWRRADAHAQASVSSASTTSAPSNNCCSRLLVARRPTTRYDSAHVK